MSYNRWMPRQYHNGGELYHYGVKGMKWRHHKGLQIEAQEATLTGGTLPDQNESSSGGTYDPNATQKAYERWQEAQKPAWQKKWEHSDVKKQVDSILAKIKGHMPKLKKRKKKSHLKVTFSDGTSKDL